VRAIRSRECTVAGRGISQNAFSYYICSEVRMIHGDGALTMSFLYYY